MIPVISGLVGAGISAVGAAKANSHREAGMRLITSMMEEYGLMDMPDFEAFRTKVSELAQAGIIDPYTELAIMQKDADGRAAVGDPKFLEAQTATIDYLNEVVAEEGMTDQDRAAYLEIADQISQTMRSAEQNILADAQQRGVAGGGTEMALKMQAAQNAGQRASRAGVDLLAMNQQRRDAANAARGQLGLAGRAQAFDEAERGDQMLLNASKQNYDIGMSAAGAEADSIQKEFDNSFRVTEGRANLIPGAVNQKNQQATGVANLYGGLGQAVNVLGQVPGQMAQSNADLALTQAKTATEQARAASLAPKTTGTP